MKTSTYFALIVRYNNVCTSICEYILPYTHSYFDIQVHPSMYEYIRVRTSTYKYILCYTEPHYCQVRRVRAYLDSLSMDGAEVAINCLCSARSCATCWCPDSELADAHRGECAYRRMAEVMEELDAARDQLLDDDDGLIGLVKDVKAVERRLRHRLLPRNAWQLVPFFELFLSAPKDELHQWYLGLFGDHIVPAVLYR